jgi:GNAT superfamily N-acetyltransferase
MTFVPLSIDSLNFRLDEDPEIDRDWFTVRMRDYIALEPDGCFALVDDGRPIGMVTSVCYEKIGWIGWLYVAENYRYRGLGAALMRQAVGYCIARGMRTILLEAVLEAVPLYTRLGFRDQFRTQHFHLRHDALRPQPHSNLEVRAILPENLPAIADFDRRNYYDNRSRALELLLVNPTFSGYFAIRSGRTVGYLGLTETRENFSAGPFVVDPHISDSQSIAGALLEATFTASDKPLVLRCPMVTPNRADSLVSAGAEPFDYRTRRMYMGEEYSPDSRAILSLGCPGKG